MYVNSGAENVSMSLNFMGRKLRNHTVAPAAKQRAWETTDLSRYHDDPVVSTRVVLSHPVASSEELPGSVPDLREEVQWRRPCNIHNTHLDQEKDRGAAKCEASWLRKGRLKWNTFKRWIGSDRHHRPKRIGKAPNMSSMSASVRHPEDEAPVDVKMFIPYDSAKLCITQIRDDMIAMKSRHQEMIQELEENFLTASQENQEKTVLRMRKYYQNKLNTLKRILEIYQEKVARKNSYWEEKVKTLEDLNEKLEGQHKLLQERNQKDLASWDQEKNKMMELFSSRLDLLHNHQASTLQELHLAREEMGKVQEVLEAIQEKKEPENTSEEKDSSDADVPLDGAEARLEILKDNLLKREREISILMEGQERVIDPVEQSAYAHLLSAVIQQAHRVYAELTEAKQQFDQMAEDNQKILVEIKENLDQTVEESSQKSHEEQEEAQQKMVEAQVGDGSQAKLLHHEVMQVALECIRAGAQPTVIETDTTEAWRAEVDERVTKFEEDYRKNGFLNSETDKSVGQQLLLLQAELKQIKDENKKIIENYTTERTLRKKYYNMVEDMKGKIRVFCRIRPLSRAEQAKKGHAIIACLDDYSVILETPRGPREFQFDKIFNPECTQEEVFTESSGLIQCAIDGFNVCIFAYGHTGSGKTFTMVGDRDRRNPGIIPRTFTKIFEIIQDNESKFEFKVSAYMLELYNDRLQDLFVSPAEAFSKRIEIKRDRKGLVFAQGAETKEATSAGELFALFEQGCANRHIAATKMNVESSRSHLIIGIMIESRNLTNGSVSFGKLSLVDLAGSERAAKTGAKDDQLKEANSINKSLSALGDVISALSMEQPHVPYRNNKLTQLMQDSLGGNAKTLMFLNISPSDCNLDETLTSLIYATRVKAITNNAQRNVDSKEIAQLKEVILKLKSGQPVEEDM
ncbi:kinesin-like protein KIN-14I [Puntigrus tetrazona]|uniref:kinesin-like protein KIN-14I n=1 Tax=Puntigrus tetrazona TaxID=1606681 RepID=UPI001C893EC7|nr:kinesin-like protein KIN-14I [Puntigrus tetrazona]